MGVPSRPAGLEERDFVLSSWVRSVDRAGHHAAFLSLMVLGQALSIGMAAASHSDVAAAARPA
jgi:hypothetical protein